MKVVPDVLTRPLGTVRGPQSTAVSMNTVNTARTVIHYSRGQVGASGVHILSAPQVRVVDPSMLYPRLQV